MASPMALVDTQQVPRRASPVEIEDANALVSAGGWAALDRRLFSLCRERGPLRAVLARIGFRLVAERAWERLGFARLSDYAAECLGVSARSVQSLAEVGARFGELPGLQDALASGTLGWTRVRLLARLPSGEDEGPWIDYARQVTAEELSRSVRVVDRGSIESGAAGEEARSGFFEVRCTREVRWKWYFARSAAKRAAGRYLHVSEAAEVIAAEVLSALPMDERAEEEACAEAGVSWRGESERESHDPSPAGREIGAPAMGHRGNMVAGGPPATAVNSPDRRIGAPAMTPTDTTATRADREIRAPAMGATGKVVAQEGSTHVTTGDREIGATAIDPGRNVVAGERRAAHSSQHLVPRPPWRSAPTQTPPLRRSFLPPPLALPPDLAPLLDGLDDADAFSLDERFRKALCLEQRLEARIGPLLSVVWGRFLHRALGYRSREAYARGRLGMDVTRARALVRVERAALLSEPFAEAYRTGALSWVKADTLAPLVSGELLGGFAEAWVDWAQRITVRRLRDDVEQALALRETDPQAFRLAGGLPAEARGHREGLTPARREIGAPAIELGGDVMAGGPAQGAAPLDREIGASAMEPGEGSMSGSVRSVPMLGACSDDTEIRLNRHHEPLKSHPDEVCWARFFGPPDIVQLFKAVLCTVRRRIERDTGRLPTSGEALGAMLDHVLETWGEIDAKVKARHKVFARDGWRCATPACTSMQNLHDHHIRFRSAQGEDALENRVTLCAFHHLRGVHAGLLRLVGRAPDGLRWELGIRPGLTPRLAYRSGDLRVRPTAR